jgi:hypothetical protein
VLAVLAAGAMRIESRRGIRGQAALLSILLASLLAGCGGWRGARDQPPQAAPDAPLGASPVPASVPRSEEPAGATPLVTLPPAGPPPATAVQPMARMPDDAMPVLDMQRNPDGEGFLVTLRPESGLPLLKPGDSVDRFEREVERLGAVVVERTPGRIELVPGGAHDGLELPVRVYYEFDAQGRFVRTTGDF